jgi:hypothetical protein
MVGKHVLDVIEQLTLRKLEYARELLKSSDIPHSGVRSKVRERLIEAIEKNHVTVSDLQTLLEELDAWGDQRIRVGRLPTGILTNFQSLNSVSNAAASVGMGDLLEGEMALIAPLELTPVKIFYEEGAGQKRLRLLAAKTRQIMLPQPEIPDHIDQQYPGVIFRPFKVETQRALAFAEIDLVTGLTFISTTLLRQGQGYTTEFGEFIAVFQPLIALQEIDLVHFYEARIVFASYHLQKCDLSLEKRGLRWVEKSISVPTVRVRTCGLTLNLIRAKKLYRTHRVYIATVFGNLLMG